MRLRHPRFVSRIPLMRVLALMAVVPALLTQAANPSPPNLLSAARTLTKTEIETILSASRQALVAKTFHLAFIPGNQGLDVLMGRAGEPKIIRWAGAVEGGTVGGVVFDDVTSRRPVETETHWRREFVVVIDFTGRSARRCGESAGQGELVVEYKLDVPTKEWTTTARQRYARDFGGPGIAPVFEMLQGDGPIASGERRSISGRSARALISPWTPPTLTFVEPPLLTGDPIPNAVGKPAPNDAVQSLWIDIESLLPLRWEASKRGSLAYGYDFRYEAIDLGPPAGIDSPDCIR
jgi:hypothetical protein